MLHCLAKKQILTNYRLLIGLFGLMSGLDINYARSTMIPLNCEEAWVQQARLKLGCSILKLQITYLSVPLGANPRSLQAWQPVLDKSDNRLSLWKARLLS